MVNGVAWSARSPHRYQSRLADQVARDLREGILRNRLPVSDFTTQGELAAAFGVSTPSMRDALRILDSEGLVRMHRGRGGGVEVRRPGASTAAFSLAVALEGEGVTMNDLAEALRLLEPWCAASCARQEDRHERIVPELRANIDLCRSTTHDLPEFVRIAAGFHNIIISNSANTTIRIVATSLVTAWEIDKEIWADEVSHGREIMDSSIEQHSEIANLIEAGDGEGAAELTRRHQRDGQSLVLEPRGSAIVDASSDRAVRRFRAL